MAKGVVLLTDVGVKLIGAMQSSNGAWFNAEGCYKYCNSEKSDRLNKHQANKLECSATSLNVRPGFRNADWYKDRNNFVDVNIDYCADQTYIE